MQLPSSQLTLFIDLVLHSRACCTFLCLGGLPYTGHAQQTQAENCDHQHAYQRGDHHVLHLQPAAQHLQRPILPARTHTHSPRSDSTACTSSSSPCTQLQPFKPHLSHCCPHSTQRVPGLTSRALLGCTQLAATLPDRLAAVPPCKADAKAMLVQIYKAVACLHKIPCLSCHLVLLPEDKLGMTKGACTKRCMRVQPAIG